MQPWGAVGVYPVGGDAQEAGGTLPPFDDFEDGPLTLNRYQGCDGPIGDASRVGVDVAPQDYFTADFHVLFSDGWEVASDDPGGVCMWGHERVDGEEEGLLWRWAGWG